MIQPEPFISVSGRIRNVFEVLHALLDKFHQRKMILIQTSMFLEITIRMACYKYDGDTELKVDSYIGSETFEGYAYGFIYSRNLSVEIRNYIDGRLRVVLESGIFPVMMLDEMEELYQIGFTKTLSSMKCIDRYHEKPEANPKPVNQVDLKRLFLIYSLLNGNAMFILLFEVIVSKYDIIANRLFHWITSIVSDFKNGLRRLSWFVAVKWSKLRLSSFTMNIVELSPSRMIRQLTVLIRNRIIVRQDGQDKVEPFLTNG